MVAPDKIHGTKGVLIIAYWNHSFGKLQFREQQSSSIAYWLVMNGVSHLLMEWEFPFHMRP
jgi:hypothetical protein